VDDFQKIYEGTAGVEGNDWKIIGKDESFLVSKHNHNIDTIKDIVTEIMARKAFQYPSKCSWVSGRSLNMVDQEYKRFASWNIYQDIKFDHTSYVNLMPDGRLVYLKQGPLIYSEVDCVIKLEHVDEVPEFLHYHLLEAIKVSLVHHAIEDFGVGMKPNWLNLAEKAQEREMGRKSMVQWTVK